MGPTNPDVARDTHPQSVRALFGTDAQANAVHGSDSVESAKRELEIIFDKPPRIHDGACEQ